MLLLESAGEVGGGDMETSEPWWVRRQAEGLKLAGLPEVDPVRVTSGARLFCFQSGMRCTRLV